MHSSKLPLSSELSFHRTSASVYQLRAMAAIPALIREGVVVFDGVNPKRPEQRLIAIAVKVRIKGENFVVTAGMREDSNGRLFYDHELLDIKRVEDRLSSQSDDAARHSKRFKNLRLLKWASL